VETPRLTLVGVSPSSGLITLRGRFGATYSLQASADLASDSWQDVGTVLLDETVVKNRAQSIHWRPSFFRVVQSP